MTETQIQQPKLREPRLDEGVVQLRKLNLRFILPNICQEGDVLDTKMAAFLNASWRTAILNRFAPVRDILVADPNTTYEDIDRELQAFAREFDWTGHRLEANPDKAEPVSEEELKIRSFGRKLFKVSLGGAKIPRKEYEERYKVWLKANRDFVERAYEDECELMDTLTESIKELVGERK